jgi:ABC-type transport system involved in cytochrome c biogenesis permease component
VSFARDTLLIFTRQLRLSLRNPAWVIIGLIQPILYLAFFGPLLTKVASGNVPGFPHGNSYRFFVPGLLVQLGLFGAAFVRFTIIADWRAGVIERLRVTPASRLAILAGRVLRDVVTLLVQAVVLVLAGLAFGLRAPAAGILIGLGFITVLVTWNQAAGLNGPSGPHELRGQRRLGHRTGGEVAGLRPSRAGCRVAADLDRHWSGAADGRRLCARAC